MILTELGPITAYRMHAPKWAVAPTSGEGAAAYGGRANRPGTPALYLGLEAETAVREYRQLSPLMPPTGANSGSTIAWNRRVGCWPTKPWLLAQRAFSLPPGLRPEG